MPRVSLFSTAAVLALVCCVPGCATNTTPCVETLAPTSNRPLRDASLAYASSVAWRDDGTLLIGARSGVFAYDPRADETTPLVPAEAPPKGIPRVIGLDSDGRNLVAFNLDFSDLVADVTTGRIASSRREMALEIADIAIRGRNVAVLGFPLRLKTSEYAQLWVGEAGAPWETYRPLHPISAENDEIVRYAIAPVGGAVTFAKDGTIAMISPAEPGVFRYRIDGAPLPTLGKELRELVVPRMKEATFGHRADMEGRYREILNKQPLVDDLIDTPDGLAIVVRRWSEGAVAWELWFPDAQTLRRRIVLSVRDPGVAGGHLRCSAKGPSIACTFGSIAPAGQPWTPQLAIFDLRRLTRAQGCR